MSNEQALADFMADTDLESIRQQVLAEYEIDIAGVYCLHTGRLVGRFDDFVLQFAWDEEPGDSDEEKIDGLIARVVASMRPTPMLNMPDRLTLTALSAKHPVDILCFLANRSNSNRYFYTNRSSETLSPYIDRIILHKRWTELANSGVDLRPWIHWLLELDAKRNLHDVSPLLVEQDKLGRFIPTLRGKFILQCVSQENEAELLKVFEKWAFEQLAEFDKRDKVAVAQAHWMRGNTMSQPAYTRSWLENPEIANRKRAEEIKKAKRPARPKSEKAQKLDERVQSFLGLLEGIMDGDIETPKMQSKPKGKLLTGANLFKKKDS